jgi:hypothetical protein
MEQELAQLAIDQNLVALSKLTEIDNIFPIFNGKTWEIEVVAWDITKLPDNIIAITKDGRKESFPILKVEF